MLSFMQDHEPRSPAPLGISQSADEVLAENFLSQFMFDFTDINVQQSHLEPGEASTFPDDSSKLIHPSASSTSSPATFDSWTTRSTSPPSSVQAPEDASDRKLQLPAARTNFSCQTCKGKFTSEPHYRLHVRRRNCAAASSKFVCNACGRSFKLSKDLKRHQGQRGSAPVCLALRAKSQQLKQFVCVCDKASYTRKDSLQRHMDRENSRERNEQHRCRICQHCCCRC
ncbi:hypothetical protein BKA66DRAFT_298954 [Pyrenochaeta sp. MPI-SDFR-AT-0127]|nr:hypothetical protein BKA66DRAFT_298954 [Pyrenochaeta sp. MPI-SDFR-AT-0127]